MNEKQARSSVEKLQKELDKAIIAIKKRVDKAYAGALGQAVAAWGLKKDSPEYARIHAQLREKYQKELDAAVALAEKDFRAKYAAVFAELTDGLPSRTDGAGKFVEKYQGSQKWVGQSEITRSAAAFSEEIKLLEKLGRDPGIAAAVGPVRNGKLSARQVGLLTGLLKNPQAAKNAGVDLSRWRESVYGRNTTGNSASLLEKSLERTLVKDGYVLQNTMSQDVPEIIGYRISVRSTNKYGAVRKRDVCDGLAGDYPKGFVFTGWHYNCRCACHPLIKNSLLTPALAAKGFVGVADDTEITMPEKAEAFLEGNLERYQNAFPELPKANYVDYRGQKRLLANLKPEDQLGYYLENFGNDFLKGYKAVEVILAEPSDPEVFMDTRIAGDQVRFNISTRTAADGHNPAKDLIGAFKKSNTGIALTREELSAASDITHEMVHTMGREHSFAELESQYPERRGELLDFNLYPQSPQRQALEMVTEWYSRKVFPDVAENQGWALPEGFEQSIGTGYVDMVTNLNTFLEYAGGGEDTAARLAGILRRPDKAFAYRYLADIIRESKVLKSGRKPETLLKKMLSVSPDEFSRYLSEAVRPKITETAVPVVPVAVTAAAGQQAAQSAAALKAEEELARLGFDAKGAAKRLGSGLDGVKKNALIDVRAASVLRGLGYVARPAAILAPIGIATNAYEEAQQREGQPRSTPHNGLPQRNHYLNPEVYKGKGYAASLTAGLLDSAVELAAWPIKTVAGILKYGGYAIAKGLSLQPIPDGPVKEALKSAGQKADAINASAAEFGQELAEFLYYYQTDPQFKRLFDLQMSAEVYQYYQNVRGTNEAQGYEQGRMAGDIIALLLTTGGLKKLLANWKRLKAFSLKDYLPRKPAPAKNIIKKEIKLLDGPAAKIEANAPKPPQYLTTPLTRVEKTTLGTKAEIKTMVEASKDHVFKGEKPRFIEKENIFKYRGIHTKTGLEQLIKESGGGKYVLRDLKINPTTGVYECRPELVLKDGTTVIRDGNNGVCSFFPNSWSNEKIEAEVKYAANNIVGKLEFKRNNFIGLSIDGKMRIVIQFDEYVNKEGKLIKKITSFYPLYE